MQRPRSARLRPRAFGTLKYEHLYREQIDDALNLIREAERFRIEFNTTRPHEHLSWTMPLAVHQGRARPDIPNFPEAETLPTT